MQDAARDAQRQLDQLGPRIAHDLWPQAGDFLHGARQTVDRRLHFGGGLGARGRLAFAIAGFARLVHPALHLLFQFGDAARAAGVRRRSHPRRLEARAAWTPAGRARQRRPFQTRRGSPRSARAES